MNKRNILFFALIFVSSQIFGGGLLKQIQGDDAQQEKLFITKVDEKKIQLEKLQKELEALEKKVAEFEKDTKRGPRQIAAKINATEARKKTERQNEEFLTRELSVLKDLYKTLLDRKQEYAQQKEVISEHIKLLEVYTQDSTFSDYLTEYRDAKRALFLFEDMQALNTLELNQKKQIESLESQEKNTTAELEGRQKSAAAAVQAFEKKQEEIKAFSTAPDKQGPEDMFGFNQQQKQELLLLQEQLLDERAELAKQKVATTKQKIAQIQSKLFIEKGRFAILKTVSADVEKLVRVSEDDVVAARADWDKKKQQIFQKTEEDRWRAENIARDNRKKLQMLQQKAKQANVPVDEKLDDWSFEPDQTANSYNGYFVVARLRADYLLNERMRELYEAQRALDNRKLEHEKWQIDVKNSFHRMTTKKIMSADDFAQEIKLYDAPKADIESTISQFEDKKNSAMLLLSAQRTAKENIEKFTKQLQKDTNLFPRRSAGYAQAIDHLNTALRYVQAQIETTEKTLAIYRDIIAKNQDALQSIRFILDRLSAEGVWKRGEAAIQWEDAKNIIPNLKQFFKDIRLSISGFSFAALAGKVGDTFPSSYQFLLLFLKLLALLAFLLLFRVYAQTKLKTFLVQLQEYKGFVRVSLFARMLLAFFIQKFLVICAWIVFFALLQFGVFPDRLIHVLFYLVSIPYFLYLIARLSTHFIAFNTANDYGILGRPFQKRIVSVLSILLYCTITIQLFRRAYMLYDYTQSQLPVILFHLNFIVLQICLIFLITKDQILSFIPDKTETWQYIRGRVDKYYSLILACIIAIIVMSHPGVGFGGQVLYILGRLALTAVVIPILFWSQTLFKKLFSKLFFVTEDDVAKERFAASKSWYGLSVIVLFLFLFVVGLVVGAKIWGQPITFKGIYEFMLEERFTVVEKKPVSIVTFFQLLAFVIAGFILAAAFARFILRKIFDLLLIEMGVQHAVFSVSRYAIILVVSFIGLHNLGLGPLTKYLSGAIVGIAFLIREPLGDLVAYFILLIQRPLKIGDYVQVDEKTFGVVRKISPRSTVLRQKNSTSIVVPNSQILNKSVSNWNYVSGFVAVDDIFVNVLYKEDPERVIDVLRQAVETHPNVLKSPKPTVRLEKLGEYSFTFLVRGYVSSHYTLDKWNIASDLRLAVVRALRTNKISLAVPVRIMVPSKIKKGTAKQYVAPQEPDATQIEPEEDSD